MTLSRRSFLYEKRPSALFGSIRRPTAKVQFFSSTIGSWVEFTALVDTGADFTLLPIASADDLGIPLGRCEQHIVRGVGGSERVYLHRAMRMRLGPWELTLPVGFVARKNLPPLLGRHKCLDAFDLRFRRFITTFAKST